MDFTPNRIIRRLLSGWQGSKMKKRIIWKKENEKKRTPPLIMDHHRPWKNTIHDLWMDERGGPSFIPKNFVLALQTARKLLDTLMGSEKSCPHEFPLKNRQAFVITLHSKGTLKKLVGLSCFFWPFDHLGIRLTWTFFPVPRNPN